jgi:hypothetical protein
MRSIARLLFGPEGDRIADLFVPGEHDEHGMAARAKEAGEWCQTTPGTSRPQSWACLGRPFPGERRRHR